MACYFFRKTASREQRWYGRLALSGDRFETCAAALVAGQQKWLP